MQMGTCDRAVEVNLDVSFDSPSHSGLAAASLVRQLMQDLPALTPLTLLLKVVLARKDLNDPYTCGLSSYGLLLMLTKVR